MTDVYFLVVGVLIWTIPAALLIASSISMAQSMSKNDIWFRQFLAEFFLSEFSVFTLTAFLRSVAVPRTMISMTVHGANSEEGNELDVLVLKLERVPQSCGLAKKLGNVENFRTVLLLARSAFVRMLR